MLGEKRFVGPLVALVCVLAAVDGPAQERTGRLSLRAAVDAALAADPSVAAAGAELAAAGATVGETMSARRPQVDVAGSFSEFQKPMVVTPIHGFSLTQLPEFDRALIQSSLGASYLLFDGGASRARIRQAQAGRSAAAAAVDAAAEGIVARTAILYLTVLSDAASLEAHDMRDAALQAELSRVRKLREVGRVADVEVLRVEAALASAGAERASVAADLDVAERSLARLTGLTAAQTRASNLEKAALDTASVADRAELDRLAIESNATVRQARERLQGQQAVIALARAGNFPRLQAGGSLLQFGSAAGNFSTEWNTGVQLHWSAWDGGATRSRIAEATAGVRRAEEQVHEAEQGLRDAVDQALADLEQSQAMVESLRTAVEPFQEVARVEKLRLEMGAGTETDYLRAEADLMQARAGLTAARYRSMMAAVEIARLTGQLDSAWIAQKLRSQG